MCWIAIIWTARYLSWEDAPLRWLMIGSLLTSTRMVNAARSVHEPLFAWV